MAAKTYQLQEQSLRGRLECSVLCQSIPDRILYSAIPSVGRIAYEIMYPIRLFIVCDHSLIHVLHHPATCVFDQGISPHHQKR